MNRPISQTLTPDLFKTAPLPLSLLILLFIYQNSHYAASEMLEVKERGDSLY